MLDPTIHEQTISACLELRHGRCSTFSFILVSDNLRVRC